MTFTFVPGPPSIVDVLRAELAPDTERDPTPPWEMFDDAGLDEPEDELELDEPVPYRLPPYGFNCVLGCR